jgi:hypothetical protein
VSEALARERHGDEGPAAGVMVKEEREWRKLWVSSCGT